MDVSMDLNSTLESGNTVTPELSQTPQTQAQTQEQTEQTPDISGSDVIQASSTPVVIEATVEATTEGENNLSTSSAVDTNIDEAENIIRGR